MNKPKRIIDNKSAADVLRGIEGMENLEALLRAIPGGAALMPGLKDALRDAAALKQQARILAIPDEFNDVFSSRGWVAYESMNMRVMEDAIGMARSEGIEQAEQYLAQSYDDAAIQFGLLRFNGHPEFRRRLRLAALAKEDYLAGRYHACVPLLLSLLDGLVNDVSRHVGFFAESADLTAWDCIAAHETGLQTLSALLTLGRNKTNDEPITIPYRNGILHGRELAFDNQIVAAKCWAALFATRDWAAALAEGKKTPQDEKEVSWGEILNTLAKTERLKGLLEEWEPRTGQDVMHLPFDGPSDGLPEGTPERAVSQFADHWCHRRFGPLAEGLQDFSDNALGKRAGRAKEDFGRHVPHAFKILSVVDQSAASSIVDVGFEFNAESGVVCRRAAVRVLYQDDKNDLLVRGETGGRWKVLQASLSELLSPSME